MSYGTMGGGGGGAGAWDLATFLVNKITYDATFVKANVSHSPICLFTEITGIFIFASNNKQKTKTKTPTTTNNK